MKAPLFWLLFSVLIVCGQKSPASDSSGDPLKYISYKDAQIDCMRNANVMMAANVTNDVTGFRNIVKQTRPDLDLANSDGDGQTTVDFINRVGGVERTNLYYRFFTVTNFDGVHFLCMLDDLREFQEWEKRMKVQDAEKEKAFKQSEAEYNKTMAALTNDLNQWPGQSGPTPEQLAAARRAEAERVKRGQASTIKWLQSQVDQGDAYAERRLGEKYLTGDGVETNAIKARELLTKAAAQGDKSASELLSTLGSK